MLPYDSTRTVKELKEELRKFTGANLGGNKAQLLSRLREYRQVAEQAATSALTAAGAVDETASSTGISTPATKTSGRATPVRDTSTPLRQGEALETFLLRRPARLHPITIECLITLRASSYLLKPIDAPDPRLQPQLQPLLTLCKTLQQRSSEMDLVSSHSTNMVQLTTMVAAEFKNIAGTVITVELEPCVRRLINIITASEDGIADVKKPEFVQRTIESGAGHGEEEDVGEDDRDLQKAIEESVLDERQREMREYYESEVGAGGGVRAASGMLGAGETTETQVAESRMEGIEQEGAVAGVVQGLPSDDDVRRAVAGAGPAGIDPLDLIKVVKVRDLGLEAVQRFERSIVERAVVERAPNGHFVLARGPPRTDPPRTDRLSMPPPRLPTPIGPAASPAGAATPNVVSSLPGLESEVARIREGILGFFRAWADDFPEPTEGHWPIDFDTKERGKVKKHVTALLQNSDLATAGDTPEGTKTSAMIQNLLSDAQFPVQKAKNEATLKAVIKELLYNVRRQSAAKSVDGGDGGASTGGQTESGGDTGGGTAVGFGTLGAGAGTKRTRDDEDDGDDDDNDGEDETQRSPRKKR